MPDAIRDQNFIKGNGTAISAATTTGSGAVVLANSPVFVDDITVGVAAGATGSIIFAGLTSGAVTLKVADVAGTWTLTLPTDDGDSGQVLSTNGSGVTSWVSAGGVPTAITVANEATDTSCFIAFFTAATGDLGPKTNVNMTFDSNTGVATFASTVLTTTDINGGTIDATVIGGATPAAVTSTIVVVDNITIDLNTISSTSGNLNITPVAGSAIVLDGTISVDAGVVTGITSLGVTGTRVTAGFFVDLTVTNSIVGSVTGTADTVTGAAQAAITTAVNLPWTGLKVGVDGEIPTFDSSGNPAFVAVGTATHVLTSNGAGAAPTFQAVSGGSKYIPIIACVFEATGRLDTFGTNDATVVVGIHGLDMTAGASQNAGRVIYSDIAGDISAVNSVIGFSVRPRDGQGSNEVSYVGLGEATGLTISDSAITYTSRSNLGIKIIGDGTNVDVFATNANRSGTETATEIISNVTIGDPINVNSMLYTGGVNIIWRNLAGTALATHTTNLPTTAMTNPAGQFIVTQNTQIWVDGFTLTSII